MRQLKIGTLLTIVALSGCNTVRGAAVDVGSASNASARIAYAPVGRMIERRARLVPEGGGFAIVILTRGDSTRNRRACNIMLESMGMRVGPADGRPILLDETMVFERPVYWPVTNRTRLNCNDMSNNYDFDRAALHLQRVPNWPNLGRGPFVIVLKENGTQAGLFNFSGVAHQDFGEQFKAVVNYMSQRSDVWSPAFYRPATFRQTLRYYVLERSGQGPQVLGTLLELKAG